ncbi:BamA/TamA family outer membrane protein [Prochlorococcus sp. MIT 1341]|uniref:BamA/TamA family outer membrane protein n=1 Tax=Prochlorococcus sp. MIT 1341 TaxID=3096221 RepID=UPI002A75E4AF|nr:BamA/TamA family outer membrane protein [Prochlorococcus sp. MIT 1341]
MERSSSTRSLKAFRKGLFGLVLTLPVFLLTDHSKSAEKAIHSHAIEAHPVETDLEKGKLLLANDQETTQKIDAEPQRGQKGDDLDQPDEPTVLITEVIIEGIGDHPERDRLQLAAYDAMGVRPGGTVTRKDLQVDLESIYATGWFSGVRIEPVNGPLGVQLLVKVQPNPILTKVELDIEDPRLPEETIDQIFLAEYGRTLNLNSLQLRMKDLQKWYLGEGYSLARITGPNRVTSNGVVQLKVLEGSVSNVEIQFLNKEGDSLDENGNKIGGKTKPWVIKREISIKPGETFNRNQLEADIKRLYGTSLFSDVKVTLKPVPGEPGTVVILLGIIEQSTGSLSGGLGYSGAQGLFGTIGLQESNLFGRSWSASTNFTYGQYGGLVDLTYADPWIKGDPYRTSVRTSVFLSRDVPQAFRSKEHGNIRGVSDYYNADSTYAYEVGTDAHGRTKYNSVGEAKINDGNVSWFDYEGNAVALQRTGGNLVFTRPLNNGNPYKRVPWTIFAGLNAQIVEPIAFSGESRPYGVGTRDRKDKKVPNGDVICIAFNCARENQLIGLRTGATYNTLNDSKNPTSGDVFSFGTQQYLSVGESSPTFNRARVGYTRFFPVNWLKIHKGCRPKRGEKADCPQAIGFQVKGGSIFGQLPPYEAFCMGGGNSVRGWHNCDLAVGRSFGEASLEYRFPIWSIVAGELFVDAGTSFDSQAKVPGKPGRLLNKAGAGYSLGTGVIVTTPVGPLRLEAASQGLSGNWRFNLGVGWKF